MQTLCHFQKIFIAKYSLKVLEVLVRESVRGSVS